MPSPRRKLSLEVLEAIARQAVAGARVLSAEAMEGGRRNTNLRLELDRPPGRVVLRLWEHDESLCRKELDVMALAGRAAPVAEVLYASPRGAFGLPPLAVLGHIEGIPYRELRRAGDREAVAEAAHSIGGALAAIGEIEFDSAGWLGPGPAVGAPLMTGADPVPRFIDACLKRWVGEGGLAREVRSLVWSCAGQLAALGAERRLVHGDFNQGNLLVRREAGRWRLAGVLDWEFAVAGSPLGDIGNFLRYESAARPPAEPHFSTGFLEAGGRLPAGWRRLARVLDLAALCELLTRPGLPDPLVAELTELVRATVEDRDASP